MVDFSSENFKSGKIYIHCSTLEKAEDFTKKCLVTRHAEDEDWSIYKERTCYYCKNGYIHCSSLKYCIEQEYKIIEWE